MQSEEPLQDIVVIYHGWCRDGFGGAYAAWKVFGERASYIPYIYSNPKKPTELEKKEVYIIDVCFDKETTMEIEKVANKLVIIDHHITAKDIVTSTKNHVFDISKSGAYLAWEYFHPGTPVPKLIQYISDSDIWAHALPDWEEIESYVYKDEVESLSFPDFQSLENSLETDEGYRVAFEIGKVLSRKEKQLIQKYEKKAELVSFEGYNVYAVSAPSEIRSGLGHVLSEKTDSFALIFNYEKGIWKCSLRSVKGFDVTPIAQKYGGGGHKNAAGFVVLTDFPLPFAKGIVHSQ